MDAKKRIDRLLHSAHEQVQEEVGALLGVQFSLSDPKHVLTSKQDFFEELDGKQILAKVEVTGEVEGLGCLVIGIRDAIRLGGTLIMLPSAELEEVVGQQEYTPEVADSYGEIANIIAGAYTKVFEDMYPKNLRFIRKEQEVLSPNSVDSASDEPVPNQTYYQIGCSMSIADNRLGVLYLLIPAAEFGLDAAEHLEQPREEPSPTRQKQEQKETIRPEPAAVEEPAEVSAPQAQASEPEPTAADGSDVKPKAFDAQKHKKRVDRLLNACQQKMTEEVSSLLGASITFSKQQSEFIRKEELFFDVLDGKQVMAELEVAGAGSGKSYFFLSLKSAIHIGGTLIMLPPSELESVVSEEEFNEDVKDAYSEIANIIAGVYSGVFEEQYTERLRFIKKDIRQIVPMKVEVDSEEPVADQLYYMSTMSTAVDGHDLGTIRVVFPAPVLKLDLLEEQPAAEAKPRPEKPTPTAAAAKSQPAPEPSELEVEAAPEPPRTAESQVDLEKQRKRVDRLLAECGTKMQEEVSSLLGTEVRFADMENRLVGKEEFFFDVVVGKQVVAHMDVVGEREDHAHLLLSLKDAIHVGGVLIMLPSSELESSIAEEDFGEDTKDAYGEIANIISGVYSAVFEEQYTEKIRLVKTGLEQVVPMKVDPDSDQPIPNQLYYMSAMTLTIAGERKGRVFMLFPASLLRLEALSSAAPAEQPAPTPPPPPKTERQVADQTADILIISDDEVEAEKLAAGARERGLSIRKVTFKDNIKRAITNDLKAVYIVMREVNEQAFGIAIKVSSSTALPLVAAGPAWTRSKVIKAVRYGVGDILLTPATNEDIEENLDNNLERLAA